MENPIKMDDLGVLVPLFQETPISVALLGTPRFPFFWGGTHLQAISEKSNKFCKSLGQLRPFNAPPPGPRTF